MYELHICTFGSRTYAHKIAEFLDEEGRYFSHRILSRDECFSFHSKKANLKYANSFYAECKEIKHCLFLQGPISVRRSYGGHH
jgi:NLI interacting factor-like phosphatase